MESLHQRLGSHAMVGDLADLGAEDLQQYNPYEDELQNVETFPIGNLRVEGPLFKCTDTTP